MGNYRNFKLVYYFVAQATAKTTEEQLNKDIAFFERYMRPDKVYLEPFRGGVLASAEQTEMCKRVFREHGVEVAGGFTTTMPTPEGDEPKQRLFDTVCYNDPKMRETLSKACAFLGEHFNEFIIDDFFFTNCTCDKCRAEKDAFNKAHGITDGGWRDYRLSLMEEVSRNVIIAPARKANPDIKITIKYPNWAESYQQTGYNPKAQRKLFDNIYTGTEARDTVTTDQHLPRYLSYSLMTYFENMWPGHNGGGWFDPFDFHITEQYLEQAYLTAFSKPKELMMFCFQALVNRMNVPALGYQLDRLDAVLDHAGKPTGIVCYLPDDGQGEDNVQDFLGMCGLPIVCTPYFLEDAKCILLTRAAAYDKDIVAKLERYVAAGGKAVVTSGFVQATLDRGLKALTSVEIPGRKVSCQNYRIEWDDHPTVLTFPKGAERVTIPVCEFRNNATWALVKAADTEESFGILLMDTYGKGKMYTLAVPDSFPDLYKLPREVLTRIRRELSDRVYIDAASGTSLFTYDNDSFIVYPYVTSAAQPDTIRIHVKGDVRALNAPLNQKCIAPLYKKNNETVFELRTQPGEYVLYKIVKE
ncbi:MAG: permease [Clostridia bacterium]|nr:permease [Clostridia bacterium]